MSYPLRAVAAMLALAFAPSLPSFAEESPAPAAPRVPPGCTLPDGHVRQHWETSNDAGKTWTTAFDDFYSKVK
jgi:hypothetical protein